MRALLILAMTVSLTPAPVQASTWIRNYDMGINASYGPLAGLPDGGSLLVADGQNGLGSWDTSIVRLDATGRVLWHRNRGTGNGDRIHDVEVTSDGSFLLTGFTHDRGGLLESYLPDGTLNWARWYGADPSRAVGTWFDAVPLAGGGALLAGVTAGQLTPECDEFFESPCSDAAIARIDPQGRVSWAIALDAGRQEQGVAIVAQPDGGALVAMEPDVLVSVAGNGTILWARQLEVAAAECDTVAPLRSMTLLADGSIVVSGGGGGCSAERAWVVRLDSAGVVAWERRDEWPTTGVPQWGWGGIHALSDGRLAVQGRGMLAVLRPDGSVEWARRFAGADHQWSFSGSMSLAGEDILVDWQWSGGVARVRADGHVGGTPCAPIEDATLPGGLVTPHATSTPALTSRALGVSSSAVALSELLTCADPRCIELCEGGETDCVNGDDDDLDGVADCADSDCSGETECDPDGDGDGMPDGRDCAPADPSVQEPPRPVVLRVAMDPAMGGIVISWQDPDTSRSDMVFDVATGSLDASADPACLGRDLTEHSLSDDAAGSPAAWYLVRARNACGSTGFGGPGASGGPCD